MATQDLHHGAFGNIKFYKTGTEISKRAQDKADGLRVQIKVRKSRIEEIVKNKKIDAADVLAALGDRDARIITQGAGMGGGPRESPLDKLPLNVSEQAAIQTEAQAMHREAKDVEKLECIARNIDPTEDHELSYQDLEYLGF